MLNPSISRDGPTCAAFTPELLPNKRLKLAGAVK